MKTTLKYICLHILNITIKPAINNGVETKKAGSSE